MKREGAFRNWEYNREMKSHIDYKESRYEFVIKFIEEDDRMYSCYIPAYGLYYSCSKNEDIEKRGQGMAYCFFSFNDECFECYKIVHKERIDAQNSPEAKAERRKRFQERYYSGKAGKFTFTPSAAPFILKVFDMSLNEYGIIIDKDNKPVLSEDGEILTAETLGGITKKDGKPTLIKKLILPDIIEMVDDEKANR